MFLDFAELFELGHMTNGSMALPMLALELGSKYYENYVMMDYVKILY